MTRIYLATPMYGGQCTIGYTSSVLKMSKSLEFEHMFISNESNIVRARNMLVHTFLKSDCTHLLFVDADVAFEPSGINDLIAANKDVIGGLYPKKFINWDRVRELVLAGYPSHALSSASRDFYVRGRVDFSKKVPQEVKSVGTGLMLIKRKVFEKLQNKVPVKPLGSSVVGTVDMNEKVGHFFSSGFDDASEEFLSEDYLFCQLWRQNGGKVYVAPWVQGLHIGHHIF
jgi:hypothetical protein